MSRAGRKRRAGIRRQPNGQPYRDPESPRDTASQARMRLYGLSRELALTELAGYEIGRMALAGCFGADHGPAITAVYEYVMATADYLRIKNPQHPMPKAMDYMAGRGSSLLPEPSLRSVKRIEDRFAEMQDRLKSADVLDRMAFHEVAYHDRRASPEGVVRCVERLMRA